MNPFLKLKVKILYMRLAALLSGGKDSMYALFLAKKMGHEVRYIVSMLSENPESYMFHVPNARLVKYQAQAMDIPLVTKSTHGIKERELKDLKGSLEEIKDGIDGVVTGAVESEYQKSRIDKICSELGIKSLAPLWHKDPEKMIREMLLCGFEIIITAVGAPPLDRSWLGRNMDEKCLRELVELNKKYGIHVSGEGGEYESFVTDSPLFKKRIEVASSVNEWDEKTNSGVMRINEVRLIDK
jgi:ABC transporter with metal-binding/Fe-S-binding domain ATP-binding protein